jgi:hypothetical protein
MNRTLLFYFLITVMPLFSITCLAQPISVPPFTPSQLQQNGAKIIDLENKVKTFITDREMPDLNFGLHLVHFRGRVLNSPQLQFIKDFGRFFCNPQYSGNLPECNSSNNASRNATYAILKPSNIFSTNMDSDQTTMALNVSRTIINPFPSSKFNDFLSNQEDLNNEDKQIEMASFIAKQASTMLAQNSFNQLIAKRSSNGTEPSLMQTIFDESNRRLTDPNWIANISRMPAEQLLMELLQIEAFRVWVEYHKFTQNERIETLLAALLSQQTHGGAMAAAAEDLKEQQQQGEDEAKKIEQETQQFMPTY